MKNNHIILIDTNMYLVFYNSNAPKYRKLLDFLLEIKEILFCPSVIIEEINRNKTKIFKNSADEYTKKAKTTHQNIALPVHLDEKDTTFQDWNSRWKQNHQERDTLIKDINNLFKETIKKISKSDDYVSRNIEKLFTNKINYSEEELTQASKRKSLGNPPGKKEDKIGDELIWEQFLSHLKSTKPSHIYLVTADKDYYTEYEKENFLNPVLFNEIKNIYSSEIPEIEIYSSLLDFYDKYRNNVTNFSLSPEDEESIKAELAIPTSVYGLYGTIGSGVELPESEITCPRCKQKGVIIEVPKPSQYGGWSYWRICKNCGLQFDTGDPYDD